MKLSEAIREGAKLRPQGFKKYLHNNRSCAIGAACEAEGHQEEDIRSGDAAPVLANDHPIVEETVVCPVTGKSSDLWLAIVRLNDVHKWTREQIADWVETIESETA